MHSGKSAYHIHWPSVFIALLQHYDILLRTRQKVQSLRPLSKGNTWVSISYIGWVLFCEHIHQITPVGVIPLKILQL